MYGKQLKKLINDNISDNDIVCFGEKGDMLGRYSDFDEAVKMRKEAEKIYFGEYSYDESMKKAKQLGIPILSEQDFIKMIS